MSEAKGGDILISKGLFQEVRAGQYGNTFIFVEAEDGEEVGIGASGGQLKSMYERNKLKIGLTYQIIFKGKKKIAGGKTVNDFEVSEYVADKPEFEQSDEANEFLDG
jgi:hypothetical protein